MKKTVLSIVAAAATMAAGTAFADVKTTATCSNYESGTRFVTLAGNIDEGTAPAPGVAR